MCDDDIVVSVKFKKMRDVEPLKFSIIICTHNPRAEYLSRTLEGIKRQIFDISSFELIIVDNGSTKSVASEIDISWHPLSRIVKEEILGLTHARLKGIDEANGEYIVFLDDDNVMDPEYLSRSAEHIVKMPFIGAFGGTLVGEFEVEPPPYLQKYLGLLAIRKVERDIWSNLYQYQSTPAGAGMVIKSEIARVYASKVRSNIIGKMLGRKGTNLMSGEDLDMAYTAIDRGFGCGLFSDLIITHLIPKFRLTEVYLLQLSISASVSSLLLDFLRFGKDPRKSEISPRSVVTELLQFATFKNQGIRSVLMSVKHYCGLIKARKQAWGIITKLRFTDSL